MTVTEVLNYLLTAKAMNARRNTIVLTLRFVMNMESVNLRLDLLRMLDLDQKAKVEVHRDDLDPNLHPVDQDLVQEAGAMTVTEVLNYLLTAKAMNARPNTIVLTLRFVMNMESANSHLDLRRMHDLDQKAKVEVHRDDLDPNRHLVDLVLDLEAGAMTVTDQSLLTDRAMNARPNTIVLTLRFAMNMVSANWRLDLKKMHELDQRARVEVTVHHGDL